MKQTFKSKIQLRGFCETHQAEYLTESGRCPVCERKAEQEKEAEKNKKKEGGKND